MAHLCGLCLALRADHGQFARVATNYDGLVLSVLTDAQLPRELAPERRTAGPCPLRGMRTASVAKGQGAHLAATVSLVLASAKLRDHVLDGDGAMRRRPVAAAAERVARSWDLGGERAGAGLGFDTAVLLDAVGRQQELESAAGPGTSVLTVTEPTELATAAAFAHTAVLAGRPGNSAPLHEAGRLFGRLAHLLDAVEDRAADQQAGAWNPLTTTGTDAAEARRLCDDAVHGIRLALAEVEFTDSALAHRLLVHELEHAVQRTFQPHAHTPHPASPWVNQPPGGWPPPPEPPRRRGLLAGCLVWSGLCCTCQLCCRSEYQDPWTGEPREGWCDKCDCCCEGCDCCSSCSECCNCCNCCNCCTAATDAGGDDPAVTVPR